MELAFSAAAGWGTAVAVVDLDTAADFDFEDTAVD